MVFEFRYGNLKQSVLQAGREPGQAYRGYLQIITAGSLTLADLGYFAVHALAEIADMLAYFPSRCLCGTKLFTPEGEQKKHADQLSSRSTCFSNG